MCGVGGEVALGDLCRYYRLPDLACRHVGQRMEFPPLLSE